ncbi:hypothetical protein G4H71_13870 [Rhodococcus triatomae]|uniref:Uncharacterized protein n=1 Tax=Rhodococcus triatomae TaxID=300028 RepID=A0A1G8PIW8_9NOCA|nr:hypothetical protein [Rhodococcus triatomae]QNG20117.1 hypothetical protein G4H72_16505 [Rhodococcus triatomae]QNG23967.1 hypothetical protein G4H71_13870 [Rhodococcus triatomae]SDI92387.1 hypothetical protein SAMN05444695_11345 [Rhodococcus triatomae]
MKLRKIAARAFGVVSIAVATIVGTSGIASAAPAPAAGLWGLNGGQIPVVGQHAWCNGVVDMYFDTDPTRPAHGTITLVSRGMNGADPDWSANPKCKVDFTIIWYDGVFPFHHTVKVPTEFGVEPGETVTTEINPGSGLIYLTAGATYIDTDTWGFVPQYSYPASGYFLIP